MPPWSSPKLSVPGALSRCATRVSTFSATERPTTLKLKNPLRWSLGGQMMANCDNMRTIHITAFIMNQANIVEARWWRMRMNLALPRSFTFFPCHQMGLSKLMRL